MNHEIFRVNKESSETHLHQAMMSMDQTIKPEGALGRLEEMAIRLSGHQATSSPQIRNPKCVIFASDHGISAEGVSEYDSTQSTRWIQAMLNEENSALNSLTNVAACSIDVVDVGLKDTLNITHNYSNSKVKLGTGNFTNEPAMSQVELLNALDVGINKVDELYADGCDLFVSGEIGVGNTTSALAMIAVLSGKPIEEIMLIGRSRIMRSEQHQVECIKKAIEIHREHLKAPLSILQHLGGVETAALCGAYIRCAQLGISIVVDGLMTTVAAWIADLVSRNDQLAHCKSTDEMMELGQYSVPETMFCICGTCPRLVEWCFFSHQSAEKSHKLVLDILAVEPILQFDMKLGQATGSTLVVPLLKQACSIYENIPKSTLEPVEINCPIL